MFFGLFLEKTWKCKLHSILISLLFSVELFDSFSLFLSLSLSSFFLITSTFLSTTTLLAVIWHKKRGPLFRDPLRMFHVEHSFFLFLFQCSTWNTGDGFLSIGRILSVKHLRRPAKHPVSAKLVRSFLVGFGLTSGGLRSSASASRKSQIRPECGCFPVGAAFRQ